MHEDDKCLAQKISGGEPEGYRPLKKFRCRREGGMRMWREGVIWVQLFRSWFESSSEPPGSINGRTFLSERLSASQERTLSYLHPSVLYHFF